MKGKQTLMVLRDYWEVGEVKYNPKTKQYYRIVATLWSIKRRTGLVSSIVLNLVYDGRKGSAYKKLVHKLVPTHLDEDREDGVIEYREINKALLGEALKIGHPYYVSRAVKYNPKTKKSIRSSVIQDIALIDMLSLSNTYRDYGKSTLLQNIVSLCNASAKWPEFLRSPDYNKYIGLKKFGSAPYHASDDYTVEPISLYGLIPEDVLLTLPTAPEPKKIVDTPPEEKPEAIADTPELDSMGMPIKLRDDFDSDEAYSKYIGFLGLTLESDGLS